MFFDDFLLFVNNDTNIDSKTVEKVGGQSIFFYPLASRLLYFRTWTYFVTTPLSTCTFWKALG